MSKFITAVAILTALIATGCGKKEEPAVAAPSTTPTQVTPAAAHTQAPAPQAEAASPASAAKPQKQDEVYKKGSRRGDVLRY